MSHAYCGNLHAIIPVGDLPEPLYRGDLSFERSTLATPDEADLRSEHRSWPTGVATLAFVPSLAGITASLANLDRFQVCASLVTSSIAVALLSHRCTTRHGQDISATTRQRLEHEAFQRLQLFASASHDLRQPIQGLLIHLRSLTRHIQPEGAEALAAVNLMVDMLREQVDLMLDFAHMEARAISAEIRPHCLRLTLDRIDATFAGRAAAKGITWRVARSDCWIATDRDVLFHIVSNLAENAIKYTDKGRVFVDACPSAEGLVLSVEDSGRGIAAADIAAAFEPFSQLENYADKSAVGIGMGLAIVKRLCNSLAVPLTVSSALGVGTTFKLVLPFCEPPPDNAPRTADTEPASS